jgi:hypothetical protein
MEEKVNRNSTTGTQLEFAIYDFISNLLALKFEFFL